MYSFEIEEVKVTSTGMNPPYWDLLLMLVALEKTVVGDDGQIEQQILGFKSGLIGYIGAGHTVDIGSLKASDGSPWVLDLPEVERSDRLRLKVQLSNVRELDDLVVERILAKLGLVAADVAAGKLITVPAALEVVKDIGLGVIGFLAGEVIDQLLADPPDCAGLVYDQIFDVSPTSLEDLEYKEVNSPEGIYKVKSDPVPRLPMTGNSTRCHIFTGQVAFAIHRLITYPPFGISPKVKTKHLPSGQVKAKSVQASWIDVSSVGAAQSLVSVVISPTEKKWQDGINVSIREEVVDTSGQRTTVTQEAFKDLQWEWMAYLTPGASIMATFKSQLLLDPDVLHHHFKRLVAVAPGAVVQQTEREMLHPAAIAELTTLSTVHELELTHPGVNFGSILTTTAALLLPDGTQLSFWTELTKEGTVILNRGLIMRYKRPANTVATLTDTWMVRATKFG
jgi:hypothetical protein